MKYTYSNLSNATYRYDAANQDKLIYISNTLSSLCIVGKDKTADENSLVDNIYEIDGIGSSLVRLSDYCFYKCRNLSAAKVSGMQYFGDSCFEDCEKMESLDVLSSGDVVYEIGDYAFARTKLPYAIINLQAQHYEKDSDYEGCVPADRILGPYAGAYSFASCCNLKDVEFIKSTELGEGMFQRCSALTSVHFANHGSCVGKKAFADCTSLLSIHFPSHFETFSEQMFKNCSSLISVTIDDATDSKFETLEDSCFENCSKLSSITFPRSINDIQSQFLNDSLKGSSLLSVFFSSPAVLDQLSVMSKNNSTTIHELDIDEYTLTNFKYGTWYRNCKQLIEFAKKNNAPILMYECTQGCSNCAKYISTVLMSSEFNDWMKQQKMFFAYGKNKTGTVNTDVQNVRTAIEGGYSTGFYYNVKEGKNIVRKVDLSKSRWKYYKTALYVYPIVEIVWWNKNPSNTLDYKVAYSLNGLTNPSVSNLRYVVNTQLSSYVPDKSFERSTTAAPTKPFDFGGIGHDCTVFAYDKTQSDKRTDGKKVYLKFTWNNAKLKFVKGTSVTL